MSCSDASLSLMLSFTPYRSAHASVDMNKTIMDVHIFFIEEPPPYAK